MVESVSDNKCTIKFNNKQYVVPYYGGAPVSNKTYALFVPQNNMSQAFVIGEEGTEINDNDVSSISTWSSQKIRDFIYPVGSIYMSVNDTSPAIIFGGTWERITGKFLLGATDNGAQGGNSNASIAAGYTGGEATHTLSVAEMPVHNGHITSTPSGGNLKAYLNKSVLTTYGSSGRGWWEMSGSEAYPVSENRGSGDAHNNMPPYLAVYIWKRTA